MLYFNICFRTLLRPKSKRSWSIACIVKWRALSSNFHKAAQYPSHALIKSSLFHRFSVGEKSCKTEPWKYNAITNWPTSSANNKRSILHIRPYITTNYRDRTRNEPAQLVDIWTLEKCILLCQVALEKCVVLCIPAISRVERDEWCLRLFFEEETMVCFCRIDAF